MFYRRIVFLSLLGFLTTLGPLAKVGCAAQPQKTPPKLGLGVGVATLSPLVQRIAGKGAAVQTLVTAGQDPHTFEPTPRQIQKFGKVRIYFSVGLPFEKLLIEKIASAHGKVKIVDIAHDVRQKLDVSHHHEHHAGCECEAGNVDPHVWLSPKTLRRMAYHIRKSLDEVDPKGASDRKKRYDALCRELDELDKQLAEQLKPYRGQTIYVFHPALGYFCHAYGLKQEAIETGGRTPSTRWLQQVIRQARSEGVKTIFVQKQFDRRAAKIVAQAIGGKVEPIDPLAPDVIANLRHLGSVIVTSMESKENEKK